MVIALGCPRLTAVATPGIPLPLASCGRPAMIAVNPVRPRAPVCEAAGALTLAIAADDTGTIGTALLDLLLDVDGVTDASGVAAGVVDGAAIGCAVLCEPWLAMTATTAAAAATPPAVANTTGFEICRAFAAVPPEEVASLWPTGAAPVGVPAGPAAVGVPTGPAAAETPEGPAAV